MALNIEDLFELPTATIFNPDDIRAVRSVTIDSRKVKKGSLFIAIKGKNYDGHAFVRQALNKGARIALINQNKIDGFDDINLPIITVRNTTKALGDIAILWRRKLDARIIAITGSSGKTSLKDIIATLLSEKYKVQKTESNNNNNIGVPLTILSTNEKHDVLVAEVGTNHFGEVGYSANILNPDYALITNIGNSHIEFLKNKRGVLKEKKELFEAAIANKGKIFINYDDPLLKGYSKNYDNRITFGFDKRANIYGRVLKYTDEGRPIIEIKSKNKIIKNTLPLHGEQGANNYLAAISVALKMGLTEEQLKLGTQKISVTNNRLNVRHHRNFVLIDDTYNSNPDSAKYAIELVRKIKSYDKKVVILGDMFELGKDRLKLHRSLAPIIKKNRIDEVYSIGSGMKALHNVLKQKNLNTKHFRTRKSLADFIKSYAPQNSVILIKGSRGMRMEEFSKILSRKTID
jgi:UDP-N-acetylmuramoyl-tripeptide--D-alanyl-D-alanine ligase